MSRRTVATAAGQIDPGPPTLTLAEIYALVGTNYQPTLRAPNATDFAIDALDDVCRSLMVAIEALGSDPDTDHIEQLLCNTLFRAGCARDIAVKLSRGAQ